MPTAVPDGPPEPSSHLARARRGVAWLEVVDTGLGLPAPWSLDRLARSLEEKLIPQRGRHGLPI